jgi:tight adherence protein C
MPNRRSNIVQSAGLLALVLVLATCFGPIAQAADDPRVNVVEVSTVNYPTVKITVEILSSDDLPVAGLDRTDFTVAENGEEQQVVAGYALQVSSRPLAVMLALDTSLSMVDDEKLRLEQDAASAFVSEMRPIDRVGLIQFGSTYDLISPFTSNRAALTQKIEDLTAAGNTRLYDALSSALDQTATTVDGSKAVVLITDGHDTASAADLSQVSELIEQTQIRVYTIGIGTDIDERILRQIAQTSGGQFYRALTPDEIGDAFRLMSNQLRNRYELVYSSPATAAEGSIVELRLTANTAEGLAIGQASFAAPAFTRQPRPGPISVEELQVVESEPPPAAAIGGLRYDYAASGIAALGMLLAAGGLVIARVQGAWQARLTYFVGGRTTGVGRAGNTGQALLGALLVPSARLFTRLVTRLLPPAQVRRISHELTLAGNPFGWRVSQYVAAQSLMGLAGLLIGGMRMVGQGQTLSGLVLAAALGLIGYRLPVLFVKRRIKARQQSILRSLPDAMDLLTICVEAGLGLDGAMLEVTKKWDNALSTEFAVVLAELTMGRSHREALRGLSDRTGVADVSIFVSSIIQADEMGMGLARPLAQQAEQLRLKRRQRAEKLAHEAGTKIVLVLGVFIMPALFMIILSPAALQLRTIFS